MMTAIAAFIIDTVLGDPRSKLHPVVLIGNLISLLERVLYSADDSPRRQLIHGAELMVLTLSVSYYAAWMVMNFVADKAAATGYWWLEYAVGGLILSFMISPKSLAAAGHEIHDLLKNNQLVEAREKVGWIVGRDTESLDEGEVTRATVETIAENTVDGIISPLFFFALGGVPLAVLYRAANTLDSMVGYKNEKYLFFGRASARFDDVLNYLPARLTGLLFVVAAWLLKFDYKNAMDMMHRDADKHPSPNGGYAEATVAGALRIRLGGFNSYFGQTSFRAYMGDPLEKLAAKHILAAIQLMYTVTVLFLIALYLISKI